MTNQEAFTKAVTALRAQGRQSSNEGMCMYRGPYGTKCALGHLIPDELYWSGLFVFLTRLQAIHDGCDDKLTQLEEKARRLAADYGLEMPA